MSQPLTERLYNLLPAVYRQRDLEQGQPLRALMSVLESELQILERDIDGLYDDAFVETCQPWVVPYLAELLGIRALGDGAGAGAHPRAQVANVLDLRRRKGTPLSLERAARDVLGWPGRVVELFRFLGHTQNVALVRPGQGGTFDVRRSADAVTDPPRAPFASPGAFRTVDVRRADTSGGTGRGLYNVPDLAFFLWRLRPYRLANGPTSAADTPPDRRFRFDPLGRDLQLFHAPEGSPDLIRQSEAADLPVALDRRLLGQDLQAHRRDHADTAPEARPANSDFYGPDRGVWIENDGAGMPPFEVTARNLDAWGAPGVLSKPLETNFELAPPEIRVTLGTTPSVVVVAPPALGDETQRLPLDLEAARAILETSLQDATGASFTSARVYTLDDRLLVLPGNASDDVSVAPTDDDSLTAGRLGLADGSSIQGRLSASFLPPFPLFSPNPAVDVTMGTEGPYRACLERSPASVSDLRTLLERAIRRANPSSPRFRLARVLVDTDDRLLVLSGDPSQAPELSAVGEATLWAPLTTGSTSTSGLLSTPLSDFPALRAVRVTLGDLEPVVAALPGVPGTSAEAAIQLEAAIRAAGSQPAYRRARVHRLIDSASQERLLVLSGEPGDRVAFAAAPGPGALQETATLAALGLETTTPAPGALSGTLKPFPRLRRPMVQVTLGGRLPRTATLDDVPGTLQEARQILEQALRGSQNTATYANARVRVPVGDNRLLVLPGTANDPVAFDLADDDSSTAADLRLRPTDGATQVRGLLSGSLSILPTLGTTNPLRVTVTITDAVGVATTAEVSLGPPPSPPPPDLPAWDLPTLASELQAGLRNATPGTPSFTGARVAIVDDRLLIFSGVDREEIEFTSLPGDSTAAALKLTPVSAVLTEGLWSGDLATFPALGAAPAMNLELGGTSGTVQLERLPRDLRHAADLLRAAIAGLDTDARVLLHEDRLLLLAGDPTQPVVVRPAVEDPATAHLLDLSWQAAVDPHSGRVLFGPDPTVGTVRGHHAYGFSADLGGGPYDRRSTLAQESDFPLVLEVSRNGSFDTLQGAFDAWANAGRPDTLVRIVDSELYPEAPTLELAPDARLVLEAADGTRPVIAWADPALGLPNFRIRGASGASVVLNGLLLDGTLELEDGMDLRITHTTLRPRPGRPSLRHTGAAEDLEVRLSSSVAGALALPDSTACLEVEDSVLDADGDELGATPWPALISDALTEPPDLGSLFELEVELGPETGTARLRNVPTSLQDLRGLLQEAIQAIPSTDPDRFAMARVIQVGNRLLARSGNLGESVRFAGTSRDGTTVEKAQLRQPPAMPLDGLLSGDLTGFLPFTFPQILVTFGDLAPRVITLAAEPQTLGEVASLLQAALRVSGSEPTFTGAQVELLRMDNAGQERLLVRPGVLGDLVRIDTTLGDPDSRADFHFDTARSVTGVMSEVLDPFPLFPNPELVVSVGSSTALLTLASQSPPSPLPSDLGELATELATALGDDASTLGFSGGEVLSFARRILVLSPSLINDVSFTSAGTDLTTAGEMGLLLPPDGGAEQVQGLLSGVVDPAGLAFPRPALQITFDTGAPQTLVLDRSPEDLVDAGRLIEAAVANLTGEDPITVLVLEDRLLLRRDGDSITITPLAAPGDTDTALELGLVQSTDFDSRSLMGGLLSGGLTFPEFVLPQLAVTFGDTGPLEVSLERYPQGTGAALAQDTAELLQSALRRASSKDAFRLARVAFSNDLLVVLPGEPVNEVLFGPTEADSTSASELELQQPPAVFVNGLLSGSLAPFPELARPELLAILGGFPALVTLASNPGTLTLAASSLQAALREISISPFFLEASVLVVGNRLLVLIGGGSGAATFLITGDDSATATGLRLTSENGADSVACRWSDDLTGFSGLQRPEVRVTFDFGGTPAPFTASLGADLPFDLATAAARLETAIQSQGFMNSVVTNIGTSLFVDPDTDSDDMILIAGTGDDPTTAADLGMTSAEAGLLGDSLAEPLALPADTATTPGVLITVGGDTVTAVLGSSPTTLADAASALESAIQTASTSDTRFTEARVEVRGDRLFVIPGGSGGRVIVSPSPDDPTTASELRLDPGNGRWGLLTGDLASFSQLTLTPEIDYTVGGVGQPVHVSGTVTFTTVPASLSDVRAALDSGIAEALVELDSSGNRLRACPLQPGVTTVSLADTATLPGAPQLATILGLTDAAGGRTLEGTMSGDLGSYAGLPLPPLDLVAAIGAGGTRTVTLTATPTDISSARSELETAIRNAGASDSNPSFQQASVVQLGDQLLVLSGVPGEPAAVFESASSAPDLAEDLMLSPETDASTVTGLSSGSLSSFPQLSVVPELRLTISGSSQVDRFPVRFSSAPRDFGELRALFELAIRNAAPAPAPASFSQATVELVGRRLLITSGASATDTVLVEDTGQGPATASVLALGNTVASEATGLLSDALGMPLLTSSAPEVRITLGSTSSSVGLSSPAPKTLAEAAARLDAELGSARVRVVSGNRLLLVEDTGADISVEPTTDDPTTASELALTSPEANAFTGLRRGLLSGNISFPLSGSGDPVIFLRIGAVFRVVRLGGVPETLQQARDLLQATLNAETWPSFASAQVFALEDAGRSQLLILPGPVVPWSIFFGEPVEVFDSGLSSLAQDLGLLPSSPSPPTSNVSALVSGSLVSFPALSITPRLDLEIEGISGRAVLPRQPADGNLAETAQLLERAIRSATSLGGGGDLPSRFTDAEVRLLADSDPTDTTPEARLLILPGPDSAGQRTSAVVASDPSPGIGPDTASDLQLTSANGGVQINGLLSEDLADFDGLRGRAPAIWAGIGDAGPVRITLPLLPEDIIGTADALEQAFADDPRIAFRNTTVEVLDGRLLITPGVAQEITFTADPDHPAALDLLGLDAPTPAGGLLSGIFVNDPDDDAHFAPRGKLQLTLELGGVGPEPIVLDERPGSLAEAAQLLEEEINASAAFSGVSVEVRENRLLVRQGGLTGDLIVFGAVAGIDETTVFRLRLDPANAEPADGLLSGDLAVFPSFGARPAVRLTLGEEGPHRVELPLLPADLDEAREALEQAIRQAHNSPAFLLARVLRVSDPAAAGRLVIVPGKPVPVEALATAETPEALPGLGLVGSGSRRVLGLRSGALPGQATPTATHPRLRVIMARDGHEDGPFEAVFPTPPTTPPPPPYTIDDLAASLETAVRAAPDPDASEAFSRTLVVAPDPEHLLVLPGADGAAVGFTTADTDDTTLGELRLGLSRAVGIGFSAQTFGPPISLSRSTVLGRLQVRELRLASEVLFTAPVEVQRRQVGRARYSYLPPGSVVPRCFRCQPELALTSAIRDALEAAARRLGLSSLEDLPLTLRLAEETRQRNLVLARLEPRFTSTLHGDPGYAQLASSAALELTTGAEDGSELGVFHLLQQPRRREQLRILLEEYLRFGLEAGIFSVT